MPRILEAETLVRRSSSGRSRPPLILCREQGGALVEVFLKAPALKDVPPPGLCEREWMAAGLGWLLGVPVATPRLVRCSQVFRDSIADEELRDALHNSPDVLFGSENWGPGWMVLGGAHRFSRSRLDLLTSIFLFDTMIENWDRCVWNPNMLVKGDEVALIDHEQAFTTSAGTDAEKGLYNPPWVLGAIQNCEHGEMGLPFWHRLQPKSRVDFKKATQSWIAVDDTVGTILMQGLPSCWTRSICEGIASYIENAAEKIDQVVAQLEHNLQ